MTATLPPGSKVVLTRLAPWGEGEERLCATVTEYGNYLANVVGRAVIAYDRHDGWTVTPVAAPREAWTQQPGALGLDENDRVWWRGDNDRWRCLFHDGVQWVGWSAVPPLRELRPVEGSQVPPERILRAYAEAHGDEHEMDDCTLCAAALRVVAQEVSP